MNPLQKLLLLWIPRPYSSIAELHVEEYPEISPPHISPSPRSVHLRLPIFLKIPSFLLL